MAFPPLALLALLYISAFITVPSAEATFCTILPFLCHVPPPPPISVTLSPPPPPIRVPPPPPISVTLPPPPPTIGGFSPTTIFVSGTLACPITSEAPRFILLRNAIVDLRCGSGSTATLLATTVTNNAGNYVISLDAVATSSQFDPNTCVLVITTRGNVCSQGQIPNVPLRVLMVDRGVVLVTSPLFAN